MTGTPIHPSLLRPVLLLGADRRAVVILYSIVLLLVGIFPLTWISTAVALLLATAGHGGLMWLTKEDPDWLLVYGRHLQQQERYPAAVHPLAPRPRVRPSVPEV